MATYRFLTDHMLPGGAYVHAGTTLTMPDDWVPSGAVDPLDTAAVKAFHAAGPQTVPLIRGQWSDVFVAAPVTYWKATPGTNHTQWELTGTLGAGLPSIRT
jgi:hypothetical protein